MTEQELLEQWGKQSPLHQSYFVAGDSVWQKTKLLIKLRQLQPKIQIVDAAEEDYTVVGRGALFSRQYFILRNPENCDRKKIIPIVRQPADSTYVVIMQSEEKVKFEDELEKHVHVVTLNKPGAKYWDGWVRERLKEQGMEMPGSTIEVFLEETEDDEFERETALKQIKATGKVSPSTAEVIDIIGEDEKEPLWGLQEAIVTNNWPKARKILREQNEEIRTISAVASIALKLWSIVVLKKEKVEDAKIKELVLLRSRQWKRIVSGLLERHSAEELRNLLLKMVELEGRVKRGKGEFWKEDVLSAVAECTTRTKG